MEDNKILVLRKDIFIRLCSDGFIRIFKKNPLDRFDIETVYIISKEQAVILLFFKSSNTTQRASAQISELFQIEYEQALKMVREIVKRYSALLEETNDDIEDSLPKELKHILIASEVKRPREAKPHFERLDVPGTLVVFISDICKCNCIYCRVDSGVSCNKPEFMQLEIINKIITECIKHEIKDIEITGGDPLTHPEFIQILQNFSESNLPVKFSTKCPISDEKLKAIKDTGINTLQISLDSNVPQTVSMLTGTSEDYFLKLKQTIETAVRLGLDVRIKSVITSRNIGELIGMIQYFYNIGVYEFALQQLSCGDREFSSTLMPKKEQFLELDNDLKNLLKSNSELKIERAYNLEYILSDETQRKYFRPDCMAGRNGIVIQTDGSYSYCGQSFNEKLRFLNIKETGLLDAWNSKELLEMVSPSKELFSGTQCYNCIDYDVCLRKRCYVRVLNHFGKLYDIDPLCPHFEQIRTD